MLERYFSILEKKSYALHWICACIDSGIGDVSKASEKALLSAHREGIAKLNRLKDAPITEIGEKKRGASLLDVKVELSKRMLSSCCFCARHCGANRLAGEKGYCGVGFPSRYSSDFLHMGEEIELVPSHTIFFSGCTFRCVYCQNWDIAMHPDAGRVAEPRMLSGVLIEGISQGSKNANFVGGNPDPNLYTILETVKLAGYPARFLPMVWNSNMYTSLEAMDLLNGVMDIYLGDFRYGNDECALKYSDVSGYFEVVSRNFKIAYERGEVILRHLVIPGHLTCCTLPIMEWVKENIPDVYFNLMFQYRPEYRASLFPEINRRLSPEEIKAAVEMGKKLGIRMM